MPTKIVYTPNYTVVGSPTISDEFIASDWTTSSYLTTTLPTVSTSFEFYAKVEIPSTISSFNTPATIFSFSGADASFGPYRDNGSSPIAWSGYLNSSYTFLNSDNLQAGWCWVALVITSSGADTYYLNVISNPDKYTLETLPPVSDAEWVHKTTSSNSTLLSLISGKTMYFGRYNYRNSGFNASIDMTQLMYKVDSTTVWEAVTVSEIDVSGSINISKGYYDSGSAKIIMPASTVSLTDLKSGETVGCKNKLFAYSKNNVAGVKITGSANVDITTAHDVSVDLNQPIYLDHTKEYIAGGAEIDPDWSFSNGGILTDYTLVGTPTIDSDYIASNFSSRNAVAATVTLDTSKPWELRTKITTGSNVSTRQKFVGGVNGVDCKVPTLEFRSSRVYVCIPNTSGNGWLAEVNTSYVVSSSTSYWFKYGWTGTTYFLQVSTDGTTYSSIYSWNSSTAAYHSDSYKVGFGNDLYMSNDQFPFYGSIDLKLCSFDIEGTLAWSAIFADEKKIVTQKALAYDSVADKTYWYPQTTSVSLADMKSEQTVGMKNNLYCTNTTGSSTASITFCEGTPSGVTEYSQQPEYVWLNSSKDTILGVQEEPDEIVIEGGLWTQPVLSSNGTWGGAAFAVSASSVLSSDSEPWKAFDGIPDTNSNDRWHSSSGHPAWIGWYNPEPLIITNIQVQNRAVDGSFINSYDVSYSDDGSTWTVCTSGTSPNQTDGAYWNIPISETTGHKYWKLISNSSSGSNNDYTAVGLITLTAYTNTVKVSNSHYWTYLQGVTYDAQGSTLAISGMSPSALTGHLLVDTSGALSYSEDTDISQSVLLSTKAYTGYDVTFTDNTYTTIQSVDKAGTKCRIYSSNIDAETGSQLFVALPVTEYEEGFEGGSLPYKSVVQSLLGLKTPLEYTTTDSFVVTTTPGGFVDYYNPTEDKFYVYEIGIYTGFRALSYSGDAYILDSTGA